MLLLALQRQKDTIWYGALGAEVPEHRQEQLSQALIVDLFKTHPFSMLQILGSGTSSQIAVREVTN